MSEFKPTYDKDLEQIILAGLMAEPMAAIENPVNPEWFYLPEHQKIASAIVDLKTKGTPVDIFQVQFALTSKNELESIGGLNYLFRISRRVASALNLKHHLRILVDLHTRREMAAKAFRTYQKAYDLSVDVDDLVKEWQSNTLELMEFNQSQIVTIEASAKEVVAQARKNQQGVGLVGTSTGFIKLDKHTGGFQPGDLIILAGETSAGKTALVVSMIKNMIQKDVPLAAYSLEMAHRQLTARIMAQRTEIESKRILSSILSNEEIISLEQAVDGLTGLYYDERSNNSIDNICSSIRRLKLKYGIKGVIVDFIQIVSSDDKKEETKLADICRKLKNIAKELDIFVIALSQLSRDRQKPTPTIARLRGSGQIEEAADLILLIYRPEVYGLFYEEPFQNEPTDGTALIIIGKGRNVGVGKFLLAFNKETTGFYDYVKPEEIPYFLQQNEVSTDITPDYSFYEKEDDPF